MSIRPSRIYARPPITECVIEVRFGAAISKNALDRVRSKLLKRGYPAQEIVTEHTFQIDTISQSGQHKSDFQAYKLTSEAGQNIVILGTWNATLSRLAPYNGWSAFKEQARGLWDLHRKIVGRISIARVGMRYINRIDVPQSLNPIQLEDFLKVYVQYPQDFDVPGQMFCQLTMNSSADGFVTVLNCGSIPSPVPNHFGFLLDIDVARLSDFPSTNDEFWDMLDEMRNRKNQTFEASITDRSRDLFQ